ncbi:MAG: hypothetical protein ABH950_03725 [Candidatus Altiarchaeota archaeon]
MAKNIYAALISVFSVVMLMTIMVWQMGIQTVDPTYTLDKIEQTSASIEYVGDSYTIHRAPEREYKPYRPQYEQKYHVYKAFDFGAWSFFVVVSSIVILVWSVFELSKRIDSMIGLLIAVSGTVFLLCSLFIFIFGVHDFLTFVSGETYRQPTFGQQFGWIIEIVMFSVFGIAGIFWGEKTRKLEKGVKSIYPIAFMPLGTILLYAVFFSFAYGVHTMLYSMSSVTAETYRASFAWIIETILFGGIGVAALTHSDKIRLNEGAKESYLRKVLMPTGIVLSFLAVVAYIGGIHYILYASRYVQVFEFAWLIEFLLYACVGGTALYWSDLKRRKEKNTKSIIPRIFLPPAGLIIVGTIFLFIYSTHTTLYDSSPDYTWIWQVIAYGILGGAMVYVGEKLKDKIGENNEDKKKDDTTPQGETCEGEENKKE